MANMYGNTRRESSGIFQFVSRLVIGAIVLAATAFLTPGFTISGVFPLLVAAVVIAVIDLLVSKLFKFDASPFGRGLTGFVIAAAIIYATKFFVVGYNVTAIAAIFAAIIYGIIDALIPGRAM